MGSEGVREEPSRDSGHNDTGPGVHGEDHSVSHRRVSLAYNAVIGEAISYRNICMMSGNDAMANQFDKIIAELQINRERKLKVIAKKEKRSE